MRERPRLVVCRALTYIMILILVLGMSGCENSVNNAAKTDITREQGSSFPVTITDDLGRKINLSSEPLRIVSLAPSNTEILFYLGLGDRVAGVTTYCDYPQEAKLCAKVGGFEDPNLEKVVALKPDLVLATGMHQQLLQQLEDAGLKVVVLEPERMEGIFNDIKMVGRAAGVEDKAIALTKGLADRVNAVSQKTAKVPEQQRPAVYYEMWNEPLISTGRDSMIGQMIKLAGGINIADDCTELYPQLSEEVIIEKNPEVMFNSYGHGNAEITPAEIAARKGWQEVAFVKTNRIYTIDTDLLTIPGPRIVDGLEKMAQYLYPQMFPQN